MREISQAVIEKKFSCQRCNECCKKPGFVYLQSGEAETAAQFLKLDLYDFTDQFCELQGRRRLVLKKKKDEACIFLNETGCSIHDAKPLQCREFPVRWMTMNSFNYCAGLKKLS